MTLDQPYFYIFLEPISKELAYLARELENSIYSSPRTMLTHSRTFVEAILQRVIRAEKMNDDPYMTLKDRIDMLNEKGYLIDEISDALHHIRLSGNKAAHDVRKFRFSEALLSWEAIYTIVKWYIEVYGPVDMAVPNYQDPAPDKSEPYDIAELEVRLKNLEELLAQSLGREQGETEHEVIAATEIVIQEAEAPGFTLNT